MGSVNTGFDAATGQPVLTMRFNRGGTCKMAQLSKNNMGQRVAIGGTHGQVVATATLSGVISEGVLQITGMTSQQAYDARAAMLASPVRSTA